MPEDRESPTFDPAVQTEDIAFSGDEMVACSGCERQNPPNRLNCLYCGRALEVRPEFAASVKVVSRELEAWENGWNVVILGLSGDLPFDAAAAAAACGWSEDGIRSAVGCGAVLPAARVDSEQGAGLLADRIKAAGLASSIVPDADLRPDEPFVRLRAIEFEDNELALVHFTGDTVTRIPAADLLLMVSGVLVANRADSLTRRKRGGKSQLLNETESSSDEPVVDLYTSDHFPGFRVHSSGFDFSCLGDEKTMFAAENLQKLATKLAEVGGNVRRVDDYRRLRGLIEHVWPAEHRRDNFGVTRAGLGRLGFETVESSNNVRQFNKFSRLQRVLL